MQCRSSRSSSPSTLKGVREVHTEREQQSWLGRYGHITADWGAWQTNTALRTRENAKLLNQTRRWSTYNSFQFLASRTLKTWLAPRKRKMNWQKSMYFSWLHHRQCAERQEAPSLAMSASSASCCTERHSKNNWSKRAIQMYIWYGE